MSRKNIPAEAKAMAAKPEWHRISTEELVYSREAFESIKGVAWLSPLVREFKENGGFSKLDDNRPFLFEIRYAADLVHRNIQAKKEAVCGVGKTNVDFEILQDIKCLIELVAINESSIIRDGRVTTTEVLSPGVEIKTMSLISNAADQRLTVAKEMIVCQGKILEKASTKDGKPHKFPSPSDKTLHIILVDARGFCGGEGPDADQMKQMTHGPASMKAKELPDIQWYGDAAVEGLYVPGYPDIRAPLLQERIHGIGFVNEKHFGPNGVLDQTTYYPNLNLLTVEDFCSLFPKSLRRSAKPPELNQELQQGWRDVDING
jgi:hypothetical protein